MRYARLLVLATIGLLQAQDGAALYRERCASCHDSSSGRIPSIAAIKQMTGEAVYAAITTGAMKAQTSGLSTQQLIHFFLTRGDGVPAESSLGGIAGARF